MAEICPHGCAVAQYATSFLIDKRSKRFDIEFRHEQLVPIRETSSGREQNVHLRLQSIAGQTLRNGVGDSRSFSLIAAPLSASMKPPII